MPNIKSAIKRVKVIHAKTLVNTSRKSALKTSLKKCKEAIASKDSSAQTLLRSTVKALDKAASKNILHKNTASRKKSQLAKAYSVAFNK